MAPVLIQVQYRTFSLSHEQLIALRKSLRENGARTLSWGGDLEVKVSDIDIRLEADGDYDRLSRDVTIYIHLDRSLGLVARSPDLALALRNYALAAIGSVYDPHGDESWEGKVGVGIKFEDIAWAES